MAVITTGDALDPTIVDRILQRGRPLTCSYDEEVSAMELASDWVQDHCSSKSTILICTDSKSLCQKLQGHSPQIADLRRRLMDSSGTITVQWVPGHSDVPGNELADAAAKEATSLPTPSGPIKYGAACAHIDATITDPPFKHPRPNQAYAGKTRKQEDRIVTRADQVLLARIRSGKHKAFRTFQNSLDNFTDPGCPLCHAPEHTVEHWLLECAGTAEKSYRLFGFQPTHLGVLSEQTKEAVALSRATLLALQH